MDRGRLRPANDVQGHGLVRVAAEAPDLKIAVASVEGVREGRRRLGGAIEPKHAFVPGDAGELVGFLAGLLGQRGRGAD